MRIKFAALATVFFALLAGCGGGSSNDTAAASVCRPTMANPDLCSGSTGVGTTNVALFTTAPSAVTLTSDGVATYKIGGGSPAYTATSSNPGVVTASVTGDSLTLSSISQGKDTPIVVVDSFGKSVTINVTVLAKGEVTITPSIFTTAPSAVTLTSEGAAIYTIGGGTPAYSATSSNPGIVRTSVTGNSLTISSIAQGETPIVVVDSLGNTVTFKVTVLAKGEVTITPPLFTTAPSAVTLTSDGAATYTIGGGAPAYTATSSNAGVIATSVTGNTLTLSSISQGETPIVIVDSLGNAVTFRVTVLAKGEVTISPPLFTTAPSAVTLTSDGAATYTIGGGTPAYTATSSNAGVVATSVTGNSLTLSSISQGVAPIVVVDALGKAVTINVTVLARGQVGIPPSIFPGLITVSDCTTNIPFLFSGGTAPFTVLSSDNFRAKVSTALPLNLQSYFTTSINLTGSGQPLPVPLPTPGSPYKVVVTVLDSQFRTATANIEVPNWAFNPITATAGCPVSPLLQIVSASQNAHVNEILAFQITGGVGPYTYTFTDEPTSPVTAGPVAVVANDNNPDINKSVYVKFMKPGTTLLTVTSADLQKANVRLIGLPTP